jgi:hypothetical protein
MNRRPRSCFNPVIFWLITLSVCRDAPERIPTHVAGAICCVKYPDHPSEGIEDIWDFIRGRLLD